MRTRNKLHVSKLKTRLKLTHVSFSPSLLAASAACTPLALLPRAGELELVGTLSHLLRAPRPAVR